MRKWYILRPSVFFYWFAVRCTVYVRHRFSTKNGISWRKTYFTLHSDSVVCLTHFFIHLKWRKSVLAQLIFTENQAESGMFLFTFFIIYYYLFLFLIAFIILSMLKVLVQWFLHDQLRLFRTFKLGLLPEVGHFNGVLHHKIQFANYLTVPRILLDHFIPPHTNIVFCCGITNHKIVMIYEWMPQLLMPQS